MRRNRGMKNLSLKLWSLLIAVALAYFVHGQGNRSVMSLILPIELQNLPSDKVVLLPQAPQAQITLRGPSHVLSEVARSALSFKIKVPEEAGSRFQTPLHGGKLSLPPSVEILRIDPAELEFVFDALVEKKLPVEVPRIGALQKDYALDDIVVIPAEVLARGPKTEIDSLQMVSTQQIDLRSLTKSEQFTLPLRLQGKFIRLKPEEVLLDIRVRAVSEERLFENLPVRLQAPNGVPSMDLGGMVSDTPVARVEVSGPKPVIEGLTSESLVVVGEVPPAAGAGSSIPLSVELPEGVSLVHISPKSVRVIKKKS